jgi:hypothetical protein
MQWGDALWGVVGDPHQIATRKEILRPASNGGNSHSDFTACADIIAEGANRRQVGYFNLGAADFAGIKLHPTAVCPAPYGYGLSIVARVLTFVGYAKIAEVLGNVAKDAVPRCGASPGSG